MIDKFVPIDDPFTLTPGPEGRGLIVTIGDIDISTAITGITTSNQMNAIPTARIKVDAVHPLIALVDWRGKVAVSYAQPGGRTPKFGGDIVRVRRVDSILDVECIARAQFSEFQTGRVWLRSAHIDMIYALAREVGIRDAEISIQGYPEPPAEVFEVAVAVNGVDTNADFTIGNVHFTRQMDKARIFGEIDAPALSVEFLGASLWAVTYCTATRMYTAERSALSRFDTALAWLKVRSRYSLAQLPNGETPDWERSTTLTDPSRGTIVAMRSMLTARAWVRDAETVRNSVAIRLGRVGSSLLEPLLQPGMPDNLRQAILACSRAINESDPVSRVTAIWDSIEFYVGSTRIGKLFEKNELRKIRKSLPTLTPDKLERVTGLLNGLNNAPLLAKLRYRIAADGIPFSNDEFGQLARIRKVRNDAVHGKIASEHGISEDEIDQTVALLSRILVYAVAFTGTTANDQT